jgi:hypothetical protein
MPWHADAFEGVSVLPELAGAPAPALTPPTVAAFYSISAAHAGLRGVGLGNTLIRRVLTVAPTQVCAQTDALSLRRGG